MLKEKGFSPVVIVLSIALVIALAGDGYFYFQSQKAQEVRKQKGKCAPVRSSRPNPFSSSASGRSDGI